MNSSYLVVPTVIVSFLLIASVFYRLNVIPHLTKATSSKRFSHLDGLRGIAALLVVCNHSWRFRDIGFINNSVVKGDYFYMGNMGALGVQIFFCITGFLFFQKIIKYGNNIDWPEFYANRIKRLAPLYFSFCTCVLVYGLIKSGHSALNLNTLTNSAKFYMFVFFGKDLVIGNFTSNYVSNILWTLPYEWKFYLSLPFLAFCFSEKTKTKISAFIILMIFIFFSFTDNFNVWVFFFVGGAASFLINKTNLNTLRSPKYIFYASLVLCTLIVFCKNIPMYGWARTILTTILFFSLVLSSPNLLKTKALIYIGEISYSVYLFHIFIMLNYNTINSYYFAHRTTTNLEVMAIIFIYCLICCIVCTLLYKYIERPMMKKNN